MNDGVMAKCIESSREVSRMLNDSDLPESNKRVIKEVYSETIILIALKISLAVDRQSESLALLVAMLAKTSLTMTETDVQQ